MIKDVFQGEYAYTRKVSHPRIIINGIAKFENDQYSEEGRYIWQGKEHDCYQKQTFVFEDNQLFIYKEDHTILHAFLLDPEAQFPLILHHTHTCKQDRYDVRIEIDSLNMFRMSYIIQGPSKDYTMHTVYNRISFIFH